MRNNLFIIILIFCGFNLLAQKLPEKKISERKKLLIEDPLTPSRAAFYSAIIPGLGQIYIGKSWKVPLVYGAIGASVYGYVYNQK